MKCSECKKKIEEDDEDKFSQDIGTFVKHLGVCSDECFYKIPRRKRNLMMLDAFIKYQQQK